MFISRFGHVFITDPLSGARPLLRQAITQSKGLSPRLSMAAVGVTLVIAIGAAIWLTITEFPDPDTRLQRWWPILRYALFQVGSLWPYVVTLFTVWIVDRQVRHESFALLRQTGISDRGVVLGLTLGSFYRLRLLLVAMCLTPLLAVNTVTLDTDPYTSTKVLTDVAHFGFIPASDILGLGLTVVWQATLALLGAGLITALRLRYGQEAQPVLMTAVTTALLIALILTGREWLAVVPLRWELFSAASLSTPFIRIGVRPIWAVAMIAAASLCARLSWQIGWRTPLTPPRRAAGLAAAVALFLAAPALDEGLLQFHRDRNLVAIFQLAGPPLIPPIPGYAETSRDCPGEECAPRNALTTLWVSSDEKAGTPMSPAVGQLTSVRDLTFANSNLISVPGEIGQLTNLRRLELYGNQFISLPSEFGQLGDLQYLSLHDNSLSSLPPEFARLTKLQSLELTLNELTSFPVEICDLTELQYLVIWGNYITSLPPEIGRMKKLKWLELNGNSLTSLPPEIGQLKNLELLYLMGNQLTTLPPEIGQLTNLRILNVGDNQLTSLPPEIWQLKNLESLSLSGNALTSVPPEIARLDKLTILLLGENRLTSLPPEIGQLKNLDLLTVNNNQLSNLPPELGQLTKLTRLHVDHNKLSSLPAGFAGLTNLEVLDISWNKFDSLPDVVFNYPNVLLYMEANNPRIHLTPEECAAINLHVYSLNLCD